MFELNNDQIVSSVSRSRAQVDQAIADGTDGIDAVLQIQTGKYDGSIGSNVSCQIASPLFDTPEGKAKFMRAVAEYLYERGQYPTIVTLVSEAWMLVQHEDESNEAAIEVRRVTIRRLEPDQVEIASIVTLTMNGDCFTDLMPFERDPLNHRLIATKWEGLKRQSPQVGFFLKEIFIHFTRLLQCTEM
jgi:hypothetical protein